MKIGVVANALQDKPLAEALKIFKGMGIEQFEPGCGGFAGKDDVITFEELGVDRLYVDEAHSYKNRAKRCATSRT